MDIAELQAVASRVIAEITGSEAGYVTSGAAAGLLLGAAACVTGLDPRKMNRLPDTTGMKDEIVTRNPPDSRVDGLSFAKTPSGGQVVDRSALIMPRSNTSGRRSPCLHGVDPRDNSTADRRIPFPIG